MWLYPYCSSDKFMIEMFSELLFVHQVCVCVCSVGQLVSIFDLELSWGVTQFN